MEVPEALAPGEAERLLKRRGLQSLTVLLHGEVLEGRLAQSSLWRVVKWSPVFLMSFFFPPHLGNGSLGSHQNRVCAGRTQGKQIQNDQVLVLLYSQGCFHSIQAFTPLILGLSSTCLRRGCSHCADFATSKDAGAVPYSWSLWMSKWFSYSN